MMGPANKTTNLTFGIYDFMDPDNEEACPSPGEADSLILYEDVLRQGIEFTYKVIQENRGFLDFGMSSSDLSTMIDSVTHADIKKFKFQQFLHAVTWKIASILGSRKKAISLSQEEEDVTDKVLIASIWDEIQSHHYHTVERMLMDQISSTPPLIFPSSAVDETQKMSPHSLEDTNDCLNIVRENDYSMDTQPLENTHDQDDNVFNGQLNTVELQTDSIDAQSVELTHRLQHDTKEQVDHGYCESVEQQATSNEVQLLSDQTQNSTINKNTGEQTNTLMPSALNHSDLFFLLSSQTSGIIEETYFQAQFLTPLLEAHILGSNSSGRSSVFLRRTLLYVIQEKKAHRLDAALFRKSRNYQALTIKPHLASTKASDVVSKTKKNTKKTSKMFFHFLYYFPQKHLSSSGIQDLVIDREDTKCPLCPFHGTSIKSILIHCRTQHGNMLSFEDDIDDQGHVHVLIKRIVSVEKDNNKASFVYVSSKYKCLNDSDTHLRGVITSDHRNLKRKLGTQSTIAKPVRQYFHSKTLTPMQPYEWDVDSDDESDTLWMDTINDELLDDYDDISENERFFMKLWNRFVKSSVVVADSAIPNRCRGFIKKHHSILHSKNLRDVLLLHLFNLWDQRLLSSHHITYCMDLFDSPLQL